MADTALPGPTGFGIGLRRPHWDRVFDHHPGVDFFEILVDNFLDRGGRARDALDRAARTLPLVFHGVGLSIGGPEPLCDRYLDGVSALLARTGARFYTDHLCWSNAFGTEYHDLIPLPCTDEAAARVIARARAVQARLGVPFGLENASTYLRYAEDTLAEPDFIARIVREADCGLLLDVNNVFVNSRNHGFDPYAYIEALPLERVLQIHLAGHERVGDLLIDTHGARVLPEVLALYAHTLRRTGPVPTLLEWDNDIPPLDVLLAENDRIRAVGEAALAAPATLGGSP